jgi:iron complex outermembrane recepter protein
VRRSLSPLCLLLVLVPGLALADARVEARKRFRSGMAAIAAGNLDQGIQELLEAYSIKPHPSVLFNVARAYESAGKVPEAVAYYRRYLDTNPPDAADVRPALLKLEARLPKKEPELEQLSKPPVKEPKSPGVDDAQLKRLEALTDRLEAALARAEAKESQPAAPRVQEKPRTEEETGGLVTDEDQASNEAPYEETVVTASRRAQSTLDAPNATTVITAEEIRMAGIKSIPELLRRVPGAEVMEMGVTSSNVSFRGFNQRLANKVLVLLDGRTEYQDFLGLTLWPALPISIDEIERIEVIRGPGSALYGANAMLGVINIITRAPGTGPRASLSGMAGSGNQAEGSVIASGGDKLRYRFSAGYAQSDKYSRDYASDRPDVAAQVPSPSLGYRTGHANGVLSYGFGKLGGISVSGGVNKLFTEIYPVGLLRNFWLDGVGGYAKAQATVGPVTARLFWNHLSADAGPQYVAIGARSLATHLESNVFVGEVLFQQDFKLLGTHQLAVGASGRYKRIVWDYSTGLREEGHAAAFIQDAWSPIDWLTLVASYRLDRHPLLDNGQPGYAHSPRVSLLWKPHESHAIRAAFATAFREPTLLESYVDVRTPVPGVNGASVLTVGNTTLKPEQLIAIEVGYRGELIKLGLEWDLALYQNFISGLVGLSAVDPIPAEQAFDERSQTFLLGRSTFVNDPQTYSARGIELGLKWSVINGLDARFSMALQMVNSADPTAVCGPCTQTPAAKFFLGASYRSPIGVDLGADVAYQTATIWVEREPSSADPTQVVNLQNPLLGFVVINARIGYRVWNDKVQVAIVGTQLGPEHQEHPFGNRINRRIMGTVTVTP